MWAMRMVHEAGMHDLDQGNCFLTLTYRDKGQCTEKQIERKQHIPDDWSLCLDHFQRFMKRLRKKFPGIKMKYYHCGEYGARCKHGFNLDEQDCPLCNVGRPHYHACLFNFRPQDMEAFQTTGDHTLYTSETLEKLWGYGFVTVGDLTMQSAAYTARYVMKKITGDLAPEHYRSVDLNGEITDLQPEYATMSNGIGKDWYDKYKTDVFPSGEVPVPGEGIYRKVPRYYDEKLRKEDEELYEEIKLGRMEFMEKNSHEYTRERLYQKYRVKKAQISTLERN